MECAFMCVCRPVPEFLFLLLIHSINRSSYADLFLSFCLRSSRPQRSACLTGSGILASDSTAQIRVASSRPILWPTDTKTGFLLPRTVRGPALPPCPTMAHASSSPPDPQSLIATPQQRGRRTSSAFSLRKGVLCFAISPSRHWLLFSVPLSVVLLCPFDNANSNAFPSQPSHHDTIPSPFVHWLSISNASSMAVSTSWCVRLPSQ